MSIVGLRASSPVSGSGIEASASLATHWFAPAGLCSSSHSKPNRFSKNLLLHRVGVCVQVTSRPLVIASRPLPLPKLLLPAEALLLDGGGLGLGADVPSGSAAPWVLPNVWPPAISATVSSSFIAMRPNVSRMSRAAASGSGLPLGPSGLT